MIFAVYEVDTGKILQTVEGPPFYMEMLEFRDGVDFIEVPRQADDINEIIYEGNLVAKPTETNKETQ